MRADITQLHCSAISPTPTFTALPSSLAPVPDHNRPGDGEVLAVRESQSDKLLKEVQGNRIHAQG